jgi:7-dehydrocholesterol reductase
VILSREQSATQDLTTKQMTQTEMTWGSGGLFGNRALGSLFLMCTTPFFLFTVYYLIGVHNGNFSTFAAEIERDGFDIIWKLWPTAFDPQAWRIILGFMGFELFLMKFVPGKVFKATVTPSGHIPVYIANGFQCYCITLITLALVTYHGIFDPSIVYDNMGKILSSLNLFAICFCVFLVIKGLNFPSTKDCGTNGNLIVDFFWGTELYPRIFGFDVKQFTNCRFGLMFWQVSIICYAYKQYTVEHFVSSSMLVSVFVQTVYLAKFYWWETGYFCSMDIQHDRAGYYICWGCLVWVPSMYTVHTYFLTTHPVLLSLPTTLAFLAGGLLCIWINYDCDRQRQEFRASNGRGKIWGKEPTFIEAQYTTKDGEVRKSLLLTSGWWGLAR